MTYDNDLITAFYYLLAESPVLSQPKINDQLLTAPRAHKSCQKRD